MFNVPYYTHCHKNYHTANVYWVLRPDLKKQSNNKKRCINEGNNQPLQLKPADDNKDQYNFRGALVYYQLIQTFRTFGPSTLDAPSTCHTGNKTSLAWDRTSKELFKELEEA